MSYFFFFAKFLDEKSLKLTQIRFKHVSAMIFYYYTFFNVISYFGMIFSSAAKYDSISKTISAKKLLQAKERKHGKRFTTDKCDKFGYMSNFAQWITELFLFCFYNFCVVYIFCVCVCVFFLLLSQATNVFVEIETPHVRMGIPSSFGSNYSRDSSEIPFKRISHVYRIFFWSVLYQSRVFQFHQRYTTLIADRVLLLLFLLFPLHTRFPFICYCCLLYSCI